MVEKTDLNAMDDDGNDGWVTVRSFCQPVEEQNSVENVD